MTDPTITTLRTQLAQQQKTLRELRAKIAVLDEGVAALSDLAAQEEALVKAVERTAQMLRAAWMEMRLDVGRGDVVGRDNGKHSVNLHNYAPNQGMQGAFYGDIHLPPPPPPMPLDSALALLAELPLDDIPAPQTLPQPHRMPWLVNSLFVGRADEFRRIGAQLKVGGTVAITTGIGGVGKTQLAVELAHRYGRYFGGGVFWLSFADPANIALEVADCGRRMGVFHDAEKLELSVQVQRTLARWATDLPCLLIFDNCEDEDLLRDWQPRCGGCRVLVTSRKQSDWSPELGVTLMPLDVLPRAESIILLRRIAPRLTDAEADQIAAELGDLPLALHLAGRYLARYPLPVADYLARLAGAHLRDPALQGEGMTRLPVDRAPNVERAFALSFERLIPTDPADERARQVLARAACFAPGEPFGRGWLEGTIEPEGDAIRQLEARTDAVERLLDLGLLESVGEGGVRLHRLLAAYAALALNDAEALPVVERVVGWLVKQANDTKMPRVMLPVLPHLRHLVQRARKREDELAAALCTHLAIYLQAVGAYTEAQPLYERVLAIHEGRPGAEHPLLAQSLNNLATLHYAQGAYERALPLFERALAIYERVLGSDHPDTASNMSNLAELYRAQGAYERALSLNKRALVVRERVLGSDHPDTASSLNNLAELYRAQGVYERAVPLFEQALAIYERVLGNDHPDTASSLNNLAVLHQMQGAYERAVPLFERVLAVQERVLGSDHPDTANSLHNLASLHYARGGATRSRVSICCGGFKTAHNPVFYHW
jgi:tetratricopeptide (TPR) repeat protein